VSSDAVELAKRWEAILPQGSDLKTSLGDTAFLEQMATIVDPEARFRWKDTEGGALGDNAVEARGVDGLRAGWDEWLEVWDEFRIQWDSHEAVDEETIVSYVVLEGRIPAGVEMAQQAASIAKVRDGLIVDMSFYMDREQARRDAGLD
jgi:SnoaL-like domain